MIRDSRPIKKKQRGINLNCIGRKLRRVLDIRYIQRMFWQGNLWVNSTLWWTYQTKTNQLCLLVVRQRIRKEKEKREAGRAEGRKKGKEGRKERNKSKNETFSVQIIIFVVNNQEIIKRNKGVKEPLKFSVCLCVWSPVTVESTVLIIYWSVLKSDHNIK